MQGFFDLILPFACVPEITKAKFTIFHESGSKPSQHNFYRLFIEKDLQYILSGAFF